MCLCVLCVGVGGGVGGARFRPSMSSFVVELAFFFRPQSPIAGRRALWPLRCAGRRCARRGARGRGGRSAVGHARARASGCRSSVGLDRVGNAADRDLGGRSRSETLSLLLTSHRLNYVNKRHDKRTVYSTMCVRENIMHARRSVRDAKVIFSSHCEGGGCLLLVVVARF